MQIELVDNSLMIVPETNFEATWLRRFNPTKSFHKTGQSPADYLGLKLVAHQPVNQVDAKTLVKKIHEAREKAGESKLHFP